TKTQFKGIGLKKFEWVTVGDNRVRETHADRAGQIYEWDNPPDGQIPGSDYQCRCVASIVVDEILEL
ncbi:MAG: phage minor head protein, partial [Cetobacterium sp.]